MDIAGDRIKSLREGLNLTQFQFGAKVDISQGRLSEIENHIRPVRVEELLRISAEYGVPTEWLWGGGDENGAHSVEVEYPIVGHVAADSSEGAEVEFYDDVAGQETITFPSTLAFLTVSGDSMAPIALDGQLVAYDTSQRIEVDVGVAPTERSLVVVRSRKGSYFKRVFWTEQGRLMLISVNNTYPFPAIELKKNEVFDCFYYWGTIAGG